MSRNQGCCSRVHTDLDSPPPFPSVHIAVNPDGHICISVVPLGFEFEVWCKVMAPIYLRDAVENVPVENLEVLSIDCDLLSTELGAK